jgi:hypothetical protein
MATHKQGTPIGACLEGAFLASNGEKYAVYGSRTEFSTHSANLPAALDSCIPLQEAFLALVNASRSPLEHDFAKLAYMGVYEAAVEKILAQEKAAAATQAATQARFQGIINKAEQQQKVSRRPHSMHCMLLKST